jgi:hypothetical protein
MHRMRRHAFLRQRDGGNGAVGAEFHFAQAHHAVIVIGFAERTAMIADHPVVFRAWQLQDAVMARRLADCGIVLQNSAAILERAFNIVGAGRNVAEGANESAHSGRELPHDALAMPAEVKVVPCAFRLRFRRTIFRSLCCCSLLHD